MKQNVGIGQLEEDKPTAAQALKTEAIAVKDAAIQHPHSATLLIAVVGAAAFLAGHLVGYRSAEKDHTLLPRRSYW